MNSAYIVRKIQEKCNVYDKIKNRHSCSKNTNGDLIVVNCLEKLQRFVVVIVAVVGILIAINARVARRKPVFPLISNPTL